MGGRCDIVSLVLDNLPNLSDMVLVQPVMNACAEGYLDIVTLFMSRFPDYVDGFNLLRCCESGQIPMTKLLLDAGVATVLPGELSDTGIVQHLLRGWTSENCVVTDSNKDI